MNKTKAELLKDFLKSNKLRREKIAKSKGYTINGYLDFLSVEGETEAPPVDMVVAFDTTGSMSSYIASVRQHVKDLIPEIFRNTPNLRMKIVAFGDYCDMLNIEEFGNAYQEIELTDNENKLIEFVNKARNTSGGDGDEFYELVIKKIVEETPWRDGKKAVLLIADAAPHPMSYSYSPYIINSQIDWKHEAKKAAKLGIQFDTLKISPLQKWYDELSQITGGICLNFKSASKMGQTMSASTYARSSDTTAFYTSMRAAEKSGDGELIGVYKSLSKLVGEEKPTLKKPSKIK